MSTEVPPPVIAYGGRARARADLLLVVVGIVALAVIFLGVSGPFRVGVAVAAYLVLPGWAFVRRWSGLHLPALIALTIVGSMAIDALVSLIMVWAGFWHPTGAAVVLLSVSVVSIAVDYLGARRTRRTVGRISGESRVGSSLAANEGDVQA